MKRLLMTGCIAVSAAACATSDDLEPIVADKPTTISTDVYVKSDGAKGDSSVEAAFLDFTFEGELLTSSTWNVRSQIEDQLLYTVGQLNGDRSIGRLDRLTVSNIQTSSAGNGKTLVTYDAVLPVAWGKRSSIPATYEFVLPADVSFQGQEAFTAAYKDDCVDWSAHDVDAGSMWYYYRPAASRCDVADEDVVRTSANVTASNITTTGKYPEYHKVFEDGALKIVAVFGKYEDGATSTSDAGISAYNRFVLGMKSKLAGLDSTMTPSDLPSSPGVDHPDVSWTARLGDGRTLEVTALLVDNVRTAGPAFDRRYEALSADADLISYAGHAGLGANIRALARKGDWQTGQYTIFFMNGCDTYAYVDSALNDAHAAVNPDDPMGTKYVDIVTNAMPSYFRDMSQSTMAFVDGLMDWENPRTFEQIFARIPSVQVVLVSGEHDNVYVPGYGEGGGTDTDWDGFAHAGNVTRGQERAFETPVLPAGTYEFEISGTSDADLYVKIGQAPTTTNYDCRPYLSGSSERCQVELGSPAAIFVKVRGWASSSDFDLVGRVLSRNDGGSTGTTTVSYESTDVVTIPDNEVSGVVSVITVPDGGSVTEVAVDVDITHTYRGDLVVTLEHGGRTAILANHTGGSADDIVIDGQVLDTFDGLDAAGDWVLRVQDGAAQDVGTLNAWAISITR